VTWTAANDLDHDALHDSWERTSAAAPPSAVDPSGDSDGDGTPNWQEYFFGTLGDDGPALNLCPLPDGRVVACVNGKAADPLFFPGLQRYYTLLHKDALRAEGGSVETIWHEDFALADGTTNDSGATAWTLEDESGKASVSSGTLRFDTGIDGEAVWSSETLPVNWTNVEVGVEWRSDVSGSESGYMRLFYALNGGPETLLLERMNGFNDDAVETVTVPVPPCQTLCLILRGNTAKRIAYNADNIKLLHRAGSEWPAVPGVSNILVTTDRLIEYTNNTPAKTGFYRLKTRLE
jgi:hypothetical protein